MNMMLASTAALVHIHTKELKCAAHGQRSAVSVVLVVVVISLISPIVSASPPPPGSINISYKAGTSRHWQAEQRVTAYSACSLRYGDLFTMLPITGWSGRGPSVDMRLYHNSLSTVGGVYSVPQSGVNLGNGWTLAYGSWIDSPSSTVRRVIEDDGTINEFTQSGSN